MNLPKLDAIRPELLRTLLQYQSVLQRSGCVLPRLEPDRRPSYRIRVRVDDPQRGRRYLAIPLRDVREATAVAAILRRWQEWKEKDREAAKQKRQEEKEERRRHRQQLRLIQDSAGGGRRRRKRIAMEYDAAVKAGPWALLGYILSKHYMRPNPLPVRHRRSGLVVPALLYSEEPYEEF